MYRPKGRDDCRAWIDGASDCGGKLDDHLPGCLDEIDGLVGPGGASARRAGPFIGEAIYPIESIVGTIQVKSRLRASEVGEAVENVASVSRLVP